MAEPVKTLTRLVSRRRTVRTRWSARWCGDPRKAHLCALNRHDVGGVSQVTCLADLPEAWDNFGGIGLGEGVNKADLRHIFVLDLVMTWLVAWLAQDAL